VIYKLIEKFDKWQQEEKQRLEAKEIKDLIRPAKIQIMKGYVFRQSNPAICGVEVTAGTLKIGASLMKADGSEITDVKAMQKEQENIEKAEKDEQIAVSLPGVTIGRQIDEGDTLYTSIPENDFRKLKEFKKYLSKEEIEILKEISEIKRKNNPVWGV
jgi:translation initiation factor 5B